MRGCRLTRHGRSTVTEEQPGQSGLPSPALFWPGPPPCSSRSIIRATTIQQPETIMAGTNRMSAGSRVDWTITQRGMTTPARGRRERRRGRPARADAPTGLPRSTPLPCRSHDVRRLSRHPQAARRRWSPGLSSTQSLRPADVDEGPGGGDRVRRVDRRGLGRARAADPLAGFDDDRKASARPMQASHCGPVSGWVSRLRCRKPISVAGTRSATGTTAMATALRIGGVSPLAGSRRLVSALNTVPRPITTNVMVIDALGRSGLGSSGPATSGSPRRGRARRRRAARTGPPCGW